MFRRRSDEQGKFLQIYRNGTFVAGSPGRMRMRLIRKLADEIDGIDLSTYEVGQTIDLPMREARMLIAEGWARRDRRHHHERPVVLAFRRANDLGHFHRDDDLSRAS